MWGRWQDRGGAKQGKDGQRGGVEFGEKVMYTKRFKTKMAKIEPRWEKGIFVGIRVQSGEFWVATSGGVKKTRSVRRLAPQDRWSEDSMKWVRHVPWHLYRGDEGADGDIPEEQLVDAGGREEGRTEGGIAGEGITVKTRQVAPRAFHIRKEDGEKHGYTRGCAGCSSWFRGLARQPHSDKCRARFEVLLKDEARFKNAERRKREFEDKIREKAAKKVKKKEERGQCRERGEDEGETAGKKMRKEEERGRRRGREEEEKATSSSTASSSGLQGELTEGESKKGKEENEEGLAESIRKRLRRAEEDGGGRRGDGGRHG